jgi:photosynthetic reaction center cytochrome c subunit
VTTLEDREVQVIQGTGAGKTRVKLYFDKESGLLLRQVRYIETKVGVNPLQIDYKDYRALSGVKLPYAWTVTWTNGQSTYEVSKYEANTVIDAAKFAKPAPAVVAPAKAVAK